MPTTAGIREGKKIICPGCGCELASEDDD